MTGHLARLLRQHQGAFMSRTDIQSPIEMLMVALRSHPHGRRLSPPRPHTGRQFQPLIDDFESYLNETLFSTNFMDAFTPLGLGVF